MLQCWSLASVRSLFFRRLRPAMREAMKRERQIRRKWRV
jgi:hypothetical protein